MVGLDDLRGLFKPMILWLFPDVQYYIGKFKYLTISCKE